LLALVSLEYNGPLHHIRCSPLSIYIMYQEKMNSNTDCNVDSILSLMGGTIFHFIVGIKIMWGNIAPYITSYLVQFDPEVTYHNTLHVYTAVFLCQSLFMYAGGQLEKMIGPRPTACIGASLISGGTYASSYCKSISSLIFCQAMVGVGIGISYSAPILCGFKHFKQKGLVTGVITTGTGAGPFFFGLIATTYVNGENFPVDPITGLYDPTTSPVVSRVPSMFRILGTFYAIVGFLGASLLISPSTTDKGRFDETSLLTVENGEHNENTPLNNISNKGKDIYGEAMKSNEDGTIKTSSSTHVKSGRSHQRYGSRVKFTTKLELTTKEMIRDSLCWLLIATAICTGVSGFYVAATYKNFGQTYISDDHFITVVGCFGCLSSGMSRLLWGYTADKIGHFQTLELTAYLSPVVLLIYNVTAHSKLAFGLTVCSLYALWGVSFCLSQVNVEC
jgi:MFS family permease